METQEDDKSTEKSIKEEKFTVGPILTKDMQSCKLGEMNHSNKKPFKCPKCPFTTKWKGSVKLHLKTLHESSQSFSCPKPECNYAAKQESNLIRHSKTHSDEKSMFCSHSNCNFATNVKEHLLRHLRVHTGEKPFACPFESCSYASAERNKLVVHTRTHTKERPYKCPEPNCEYSTIKAGNLKSHQLTHAPKEGEERPSFPCPICEYKGKINYLLSQHMKTHSLEKPFVCSTESCGFRCKTKMSLRNHLKLHTDELRYKCELCSFRGKIRSNVTRHLKLVHSDHRPFKCEESKCAFAAKTTGNLKAHLLIHSGEKTYTCCFPGCDFRSLTKNNVKAHEYNIHSEEKKEKCMICLYKCKTKSDLTIHMRTHTKEEPYKCKENGCEYRAKASTSLRQHEKTKHL